MIPEHPQQVPDDADTPAPPELVLALRRLRSGPVEIAPDVDAAVMRAARERLNSCDSPPRSRFRAWRLWPMAAAACFPLFWFASRTMTPQEALTHSPSQTQDDAAAIILREVSALFPNQVRSIIKDESGLQMTLADQPDVQPSQALVLRVCEPRGCKEIITFSGQNIEVAGHTVTVRAESGGRVTLDGERFLWSSDFKGNPAPGVHIESRRL
jgi:hypothetical protein